MSRTAVVGGGAAGFFLAVNLKEMVPQMQVDIFERSNKVLSKVELSGGGRCNCTNSFASVGDLSAVYPRGHRLMKRLLKGFGPGEAFKWFEAHGVPLVTQDDGCVFPRSQDARSVSGCFRRLAERYGVRVFTGRRIEGLDDVRGYDYVVVTTGGSQRAASFRWLEALGHEVEPPVPSLFTLSVADQSLRSLAGTVVEGAVAFIPGMKWRSAGPLLVTHWGMSGPAVLRLSSYAARFLSEKGYRTTVAVNWTGIAEDAAHSGLQLFARRNERKQLATIGPFGLPLRLWQHLLERSVGTNSERRWADVTHKDINRIVNTLVNDCYEVSGRAPFRDEFVTCGGISLKSINPSTLESRSVPGLFFAGEVLDIDGVTGGFNFQAAWTTAYQVACSIANKGI